MTKAEKKRLAMAKRQKQLEALGMTVSVMMKVQIMSRDRLIMKIK